MKKLSLAAFIALTLLNAVAAAPARAVNVNDQTSYQGAVDGNAAPNIDLNVTGDITFDPAWNGGTDSFATTLGSGAQSVTFTDTAAHILEGVADPTLLPFGYNFSLLRKNDPSALSLNFNNASPLTIQSFLSSGTMGFDDSALGGAIRAAGALTLTGSGAVTFDNNMVISGGDNSIRGGAVYVGGSFTMGGDANGKFTFTGNQAQNADNSGILVNSGLGGAIFVGGAAFFNNATYIFANNFAFAGGGGSGGGQGGALNLAGPASFNDGSYTFSSNEAYSYGSDHAAYGGAIAAQNGLFFTSGSYLFDLNGIHGADQGGAGSMDNSCYGGALYVAGGPLVINNGDYTFSNNFIVNEKGDYSGRGGAIYSAGDLIMSGGSYAFTGNFVQGLNTGMRDSILGGAIYANGATVDITGAAFTGNSIVINNLVSETNGWGGAIFYDLDGVASGTFNLTSASGGDPILFQNNAHNPGGENPLPNSIYFGNTATNAVDTAVPVNVTMSAADGASFKILDPMGSQADDFAANSYNNVIVNISKVGSGTWVLAGHNDMRGAGAWSIDQGALQLIGGTFGDGATGVGNDPTAVAHIDLSHSGSSFTLKSGAGLAITPGAGPHQITAASIALENGSIVALADSQDALGGEFLTKGKTYTVLKLNSPNLTNNSSLGATSGTVQIGDMIYKYSKLAWNAALNELSVFINGGRPVPPPGTPDSVQSALSAPGAIFVQSPIFGLIRQRAFNNFSQTGEAYHKELAAKDSAPAAGEAAGGANGLWFTPTYSSTNQNRHNGVAGYDLRTPGATLGYDRRLSDSVFLGAAAAVSRPDFEAHDAEVTANDFTFALYGGVSLPAGMELSLMACYGWTSYDQTRWENLRSFDSDYNSRAFSAGAELARPFALAENWTLRPYASYQYLHLSVDGYDEGNAAGAVSLDDYSQILNRLKAGADLIWRHESGASALLGLNYTGLYGDREAETTGRYTLGQAGRFTAVGNGLDENSLGVELLGELPVSDNISLTAGYSMLVGAHASTHQGQMGIAVSW